MPALIRSIEEAEKRAIPKGSRNPYITEEELLVFIRSSIITSQTRAVIVLGEIGDKSTLSALEKFSMDYYENLPHICLTTLDEIMAITLEFVPYGNV